ncbi:MAG: hypothetical protein R3D56_04075 [Paracoccaceae bacterium]
MMAWKTGHTEEAGYGLVGSAVKDERRIVFVDFRPVERDKERAEEAARGRLGLSRIHAEDPG